MAGATGLEPAALLDVVEFYNQRFNLGFTDQQKADLVAFLGSLIVRQSMPYIARQSLAE
jgi:hypothetical protein